MLAVFEVSRRLSVDPPRFRVRPVPLALRRAGLGKGRTHGRQARPGLKGAWVLHMLRVQLGDDVFFELLRAWATQFADQSVTTLDFFRLAEQISDRDLTRFRRQWLETSGVPDNILVWAKTENGVEVRACNQRDEPYEFDVPLQFTDSDTTTTLNFHLADDALETYQLDFEPSELIVDPEQQVLGSLRVQLTDGTPSCILSLGTDDY